MENTNNTRKYASKKGNIYSNKPFAFSTQMVKGVQKQASLDYKEGDKVKHIKFGTGTVKKIEDGAKDFLVTVEFDSGDTRNLYATFAKLEKL